MKKRVSKWLFLLFSLSVLSVPFLYSDTSASPDKKKVDKDSSEIYVYIKEGGKRYHKKNCSLVKTGKTRVTLTEALKRGYTPCKICKPPVAEEVMVFVNASGKKFHKQGCQMIKKDAKKMGVSEALKKGYTPCKICNPLEEKKKSEAPEAKKK